MIHSRQVRLTKPFHYLTLLIFELLTNELSLLLKDFTPPVLRLGLLVEGFQQEEAFCLVFKNYVWINFCSDHYIDWGLAFGFSNCYSPVEIPKCHIALKLILEVVELPGSSVIHKTLADVCGLCAEFQQVFFLLRHVFCGVFRTGFQVEVGYFSFSFITKCLVKDYLVLLLSHKYVPGVLRHFHRHYCCQDRICGVKSWSISILFKILLYNVDHFSIIKSSRPNYMIWWGLSNYLLSPFFQTSLHFLTVHTDFAKWRYIAEGYPTFLNILGFKVILLQILYMCPLSCNFDSITKPGPLLLNIWPPSPFLLLLLLTVVLETVAEFIIKWYSKVIF